MSRHSLTLLGSVLILPAFLSVVLSCNKPPGSIESIAGLLGGLVPLVVYLLILRTGNAERNPVPATTAKVSGPSKSIQRQIAWWQERLPYLQEGWEPGLPDPAEALAQCLNSVPENIGNAVPVVVLRGHSAWAEVGLYKDLASREADRVLIDLPMHPLYLSFRPGSEPCDNSALYYWELQWVDLSANDARSARDVMADSANAFPGAALFASVLMGLGSITRDGFSAEMLGYRCRTCTSDSWWKIAHISYDPRTDCITVGACVTIDDAFPDFSVPVFA